METQKVVLNEGERLRFTGLCVRVNQQRVLLQNVCHKGKLVRDHLWLDKTDRWQALEQCPKIPVTFIAEVKSYNRNYHGRKPHKTDYTLHDITKLRVINKK